MRHYDDRLRDIASRESRNLQSYRDGDVCRLLRVDEGPHLEGALVGAATAAAAVARVVVVVVVVVVVDIWGPRDALGREVQILLLTPL